MGICKGVDLQALTSDTISLGFLNSCDSLYWDVPRKLYSDDEGPYAIGICSSFTIGFWGHELLRGPR